ncbi:MAG TPA: MFS transporter [Leptolyngbyaceae cyanobacterium]
MWREYDAESARDWENSHSTHQPTKVEATKAPTAVTDSSVEALVETSAKDAKIIPLEQGGEADQGFWPVLRNRNFLTLWGGQVFSQMADKVYLVLMIAIIASQFDTPGQTISGWVSGIMIAFTIPAVLFGSLAGVYVDRWAKKPVLVLTNWLRGVLVLMLPALPWIAAKWPTLFGVPTGFLLLLIVTFLVSTLTQFFAPAEQAVIPLIVEKRHLLSANSLYTTTMMASVIIGFAVGEPLLAIADRLLAPLDGGSGMGKDILVGLSYGIAGLLLLTMKTRQEKVYASETVSHVWQDIRDGLDYLGKQAQVRGAIIQLVVLFSVFAALAVLAVRLAELMPSLKSSQFGFLLAAGGVGMAIGATFIGQFGQRFSRRHLSLYGSVGIALCLAGLAWTTDRLWPSLVLILLLGLFAALVGIPMQTTIQEKTPEDMRGKVFGLQNNLANIALSLPLALAGIAEAYIGLSNVFIALGLLVAAGGVVTWYISDTGSAKANISSQP